MKCAVCLQRTATNMCKPCHRSYLKYAFDSGAIIDVVIWAAERARRFERKRLARTPARSGGRHG